MQLTTPRKAALTTIATLGLVGALFTPAAGAQGRPDEAPGQAKKDDAAQVHTGNGAGKDHDGDADRDRGTAHTEDTDTNDGGTKNNVVDGGDNRHPSGKDRSVEHGKGGNQGKAESDPDDDGRGPDRTNGGPDKPNGSGGVDKADQDGNNGCGNDDDFEDDNEGWCGKAKPAAEAPETTPTTQKPAQQPKQEDKGGKSSGKPAKGDTPCPKGGGKDEGMGKGCGHSCTKGGGHEKGKGKGHTEDCPATPTTGGTGGVSTETCPAGTVDTNGAMAGGCATVGGAVLGNAAEADTDDDGDYVGGIPKGEVLGNTAERPAAAELPATAETVRAASASGATAFRVGALAFTGAGISILMAVALGLLLVGFVLVRSTRRHAEATR